MNTVTVNPTPSALHEFFLQHNHRELFSAQDKLRMSMAALQKAVSDPGKSYYTYQNAINLCREIDPNITWRFTSYEDIQRFFITVPLDNYPVIEELLYKRSIYTITYEEYLMLRKFHEEYLKEDNA